MLNLLLQIFSHSITRWICLGAILSLSSFGFGYSKGHSSLPPLKVKEIKVQKKDAHLRSRALVSNGHTYYKESYINSWLKYKKIDGSFLNLADNA